MSGAECTTEFDEDRVVEAILANYSGDRATPILLALQVFKSPDLAEALGAGEAWWKAQIAAADAYLAADAAVRELGRDEAGLYAGGYYFGDGLLACAKRGLFVQGLQMARDRAIQDNDPEAVASVSIDGNDIPLAFLGLPSGYPPAGMQANSAAYLRAFAPAGRQWLFCSDEVAPIDPAQYTNSNPRFMNHDDETIQVELTRDEVLRAVVVGYFDELGATTCT